MEERLHFLLLEDLPADAEFVTREVRKAFPHAEFRHVDTRHDFLTALADFHPDVILSDYSLPDFDGLSALQLTQERAPGTPFILVTGSINEETAVKCMKAGAWDYLLKDHLRRLDTAIFGVLAQRLARAERTRAEDELRESEERLRLALQATNLGLYDLNLRTGETVVSAEYARMLGYDPETFRETHDRWRENIHPDDREATLRANAEYLAGARDEYRVEYRLRTKDGGWIWVLSLGKLVASDAQGRPLRMLGTHTDISAHKHSEAELLRLNRTLRVLSLCNETLVRASSEQELLDQICRNLIEVGGYLLAWVGFPEAEPGSIKSVAMVGTDGDRCLCLHEHARDPSCPTVRAIREARPILEKPTDDAPPHLLQLRQSLGVHAIIALPLLAEAERFGALTIYSQDAEAFDAKELQLLTELANDLAFGIKALRTQAAHQNAEAALKLNTLAIEASSNGIMIVAIRGSEATLVYVNPAFERMTGYPGTEALDKEVAFFLRAEDNDPFALEDLSAALRQKHAGVTLRCRHKNGQLFWCEITLSPVADARGEVKHCVANLTDVSERKRYEEELEHQATHDALTGLANRNLLTDRLMQSIDYADRSQRVVAVLLFDIDRFKVVNDSLGHVTGDELLCLVAQQLAQHVRPCDTVARLGGDEFVVTLAEIADIDDVVPVTEKLLAALATPFTVDGRQLHVTASTGISLYPKDGRDTGALLRCADIAMYQAKEEGGNGFRFFAPDMNLHVMETLELEGELRRAIEQEELLLYYQPLVDLSSGAIIGAEALLRWPHAQRGMIPPLQFIPLAEETGLILPIGEWVLRTVCARLKSWQDDDLPAVTIAANISARQFHKEKLSALVQKCLRESGADPHFLELELTESMLMRQPEAAAEAMTQLKALGVTLSLDDFGTGYSSLNYLRRFPFDNLKIDRSFITDVASDPSAAAVATSIVAISHSLGMRSIAEGIETIEQLRFLRACKCDKMQGYYFSRPLPESEFTALLRSGKRLQLN